ncbi:altered inheritance of mitochondria protein 21-like [Belonocnema kinseyi]|uniref:altered inheritance of mitochondria protein 21-like n=1 Tax=Belonocnema kinseyi TaxID=2817044 RepID=UPI00143D1B45|nr:altered inheritance of mitochondria protein 21-like [Belonocnema kinseyi]
MALLNIIFPGIIVIHNFIYCLANPMIFTPRDSLTIEKSSPVEIVTPSSESSMLLREEDILPTEIINLPTESSSFSSEMMNSPTESSHISQEVSHLPTEASHFATEIPDLPKEENKTIPKPIKNEHSNRIPRFLGRLALLAGLGLAGLANAASAINLGSRDPEAPLTLSSPPEKLSPYFAAVYEPFSYSQPQFYSNILGLFPFLNPPKYQPEDPVSVVADNSNNPYQETISTASDETGEEVVNEEEFPEEYIAENRNDDNITMEGRIRDDDVIEEQATFINENTTPVPPEEESEESHSDEEEGIDLTAESTEESEDTTDLDDFKYELLSSEGEEATVKPIKPVRPAKQNAEATTNKPSTEKPTKRKPTSKKPTTRKTTAKVKPTSPTDMQNTTTENNSTDSESNTGYPYFPGYYGGNPQNVHDIFLTSTGTPFTHESYNEIPHYTDDWSNRVATDQIPFEGFSNPYYEFRSPIVNEPNFDGRNYFIRFPTMEVTSPPEFINSGFRPSFQYSRRT